MKPESLLVVGSIAFDAVRTPFGERERMLGGSAVHFSLAASLAISGETSRGTAMSMKNIGRFLRRARNCSPCSRRKIA